MSDEEIVKADIKEARKQSNEVKYMMYKDVICLYLKCLFLYPNELELRRKMVRMMQGFFNHLKNEAEIFKVLGKAYISLEEFDEIMIRLDEEFERAFAYYEEVLDDVEVAMEVQDLKRFLFRNEKVQAIDTAKKEEILQLIFKLEKANYARDRIEEN